MDLEAQTEYGTAPADREWILEILVQAGRMFSQHKLAKAAGVSLSSRSGLFEFPQKRGIDVVEEETFDESLSIPNPDLVERATEMFLDGVFRDVERRGDLRSGQASHDKVHNHYLPPPRHLERLSAALRGYS
jgi:hypothetical protein